jgi:glycerophosphoryl diester phosphodiesterase
MNADYIELDVQQSKDGVLVIMHDRTVDRTTNGSGHVRELTYAELQRLDAGSWKDDSFTNEKIPTLSQVLDEFQGKIGILIELKAPELYPGIERKVAFEINKRKLDHVIIQSFNVSSMKKMHEFLPNVPIGILSSSKQDANPNSIQQFAAFATYFNPSYDILTPALIHQVHSAGMKISPWSGTKRLPASFLWKTKSDGVITNYPDEVNWAQTSTKIGKTIHASSASHTARLVGVKK